MKLQTIIEGLAAQEKRYLFVILKKELGETPRLDDVKSKINDNLKILCPNCHTDDVYGHGIFKGSKDINANNGIGSLMILLVLQYPE